MYSLGLVTRTRTDFNNAVLAAMKAATCVKNVHGWTCKARLILPDMRDVDAIGWGSIETKARSALNSALELKASNAWREYSARAPAPNAPAVTTVSPVTQLPTAPRHAPRAPRTVVVAPPVPTPVVTNPPPVPVATNPPPVPVATNPPQTATPYVPPYSGPSGASYPQLPAASIPNYFESDPWARGDNLPEETYADPATQTAPESSSKWLWILGIGAVGFYGYKNRRKIGAKSRVILAKFKRMK